MKPTCKFNENGDVLRLVWNVQRCMRENGLENKQDELFNRVVAANSYEQAREICEEYVELI
jgi:hypothetical protein